MLIAIHTLSSHAKTTKWNEMNIEMKIKSHTNIPNKN